MSGARVKGPRIDVEAAKAMVDADEAIILDVVGSHVWPSMTRTVQGSIRIPPEEIERRFVELLHDKAIVAYCT